jgi:hypothetical protein
MREDGEWQVTSSTLPGGKPVAERTAIIRFRDSLEYITWSLHVKHILFDILHQLLYHNQLVTGSRAAIGSPLRSDRLLDWEVDTCQNRTLN